MRFSCCIILPKIVNMHIIQTQANAIQIIAIQRTNNSTNVLQCFAYSQEWCTNFKGRKVAALCARDLRQWDCSNCHLITLRFIIPARITTSICHALPLVYIHVPCFSVSVSDYNWPWMLLHIHRCRYTLLTRINERMNVARSIGSSFFFQETESKQIKIKRKRKDWSPI